MKTRRHVASVIAGLASAVLMLAGCSSSGGANAGSGAGTTPVTTSGATDSSGSTASSSGSGSGPSSVTTAPAASRKPLTIAINSTPGTLDPALALGNALVIGRFLYDPLVNLTADGKVVSGLAESWTLTDKGAIFVLRQGVTCSDGHALVASDVKKWFDHIIDPATNPPIILSYFGGQKFQTKADDTARTFEITLDNPYSFLLQALTNVGVVCPGGLADPKKLFQTADGTGPYTLSNVNPDIEYQLALRQDYQWGPDGVSAASLTSMPSQVSFKVVADADTGANMMLSNQINLLQGDKSIKDRLAADAKITATVFQGSDSLYLFPNQHPGTVLADEPVRKAIALAIDRDSWAAAATGGEYTIANSLTTTSPPMCPDTLTQAAVPTGNLDQAKALLDGDGWKEGAGGKRTKDGKELSVKILGISGASAQWEYTQQVLGQLGIGSTIDLREARDYGDQLAKGIGWDLTYISLGTASPSLWTALLNSPDKSVYAGINNPAYNDLAGKALGTPGEAGCQLWDQAGAEIMKAVNVYPIATTKQFVFTTPGVGFQMTDFYFIPTSMKATT